MSIAGRSVMTPSAMSAPNSCAACRLCSADSTGLGCCNELTKMCNLSSVGSARSSGVASTGAVHLCSSYDGSFAIVRSEESGVVTI